MAWLRRNKTQTNTIPELQEYYNAEKRERSGLSWLLALVSVACAGLLIIGLIFGGKWLYRKLAHNMNKNKTTTAQVQNQPSNQPATPAESGTSPTTTSGDTATGTTNSASNTSTPATPPSTASAPAASTPAPATSTSPTVATTTTPAASTPISNSALPHTGPAGTLAIFSATAISATILRYTLFKRKFLK